MRKYMIVNDAHDFEGWWQFHDDVESAERAGGITWAGGWPAAHDDGYRIVPVLVLRFRLDFWTLPRRILRKLRQV